MKPILDIFHQELLVMFRYVYLILAVHLYAGVDVHGEHGMNTLLTTIAKYLVHYSEAYIVI